MALLAAERADRTGLPVAAADDTLFVADTALVNAEDPALARVLASRPDLVFEPPAPLPEPPAGVDRSRLRDTVGMPRIGRLRFRGAEQPTAALVDALGGADLGVSSVAAAGT